MAASSILTAISGIFATPEYTDRVPSSARTAIAAGNYGQQNFPTDINNAVYDALVNKIARQNIYGFVYNGVDFRKYNKGYLGFGAIIEDDYVDVMKADEPTALPVDSEYDSSTDWDFSKYDPFKINYPNIRTAYYMNKFYLQYHVTTAEEYLKMALNSEGGATDMVSRIRNVLPESEKLDEYLIFRHMLADATPSHTIYAKSVDVSVAANATKFTAEESINIVATIRNYVSAFRYSQTQFNALGVLNSCPKENCVLFISEGIYNLLSAAQYNAFHKDLDFGCRIELIDGFGEDAATTGQFAALLDERGFKMYDWLAHRMDNIYNPVSGGYWNTFLKYGGLIGYGLHNNAVRFNLTSAS